MPEHPKETCFQEAKLDDGLKLSTAPEAEAEAAPDLTPEPAAPAESNLEKAGIANGPATENNSSNSTAKSRDASNARQFIPGPKAAFTCTKAPYYGLLRHRLIVGACFCFAALILSISTIDFKALTSHPSMLRKHQSAQNFTVSNPPQIPDLPPNLSYVQTWNAAYGYGAPKVSEISEGMRTVVEPTWEGERIGFVNEANQVVIKPQFAAAQDFHDGLAAAQSLHKEGTWGFINKSGKFVIMPEFSEVSSFRNGVAAVCFADARPGALIDHNGRILAHSDSHQKPIDLGQVFAVMQSGKFGLVDRNGHWLAGPRFDRIESFNDPPQAGDPQASYTSTPEQLRLEKGYFRVWKDRRCGVIDKYGKLVIPIKFGWIDALNNNVAKVRDMGVGNVDTAGRATDSSHTNNIGFADSNGKYIVPPTMTDATGFGPLTAVTDGKTWSVIDSRGRPVKTVAFDAPIVSRDQEWMSEGLAPVFINSKVGFLNRKGELAILPRFAFATGFQEGYARVWDGKLWGYIDRQGNYASPLRFASAAPFVKGEAQVTGPGPFFFFSAGTVADEFNSRIPSSKNRFTPITVIDDHGLTLK